MNGLNNQEIRPQKKSFQLDREDFQKLRSISESKQDLKIDLSSNQDNESLQYLEEEDMQQMRVRNKTFSRKSMILQRKGLDEFERFKIPPNWSEARQHGMARRVTKESKNSKENKVRCRCCTYEIYRQEIDLNSEIEDLGFLGPGYSLFFNFTKYCIYILFVFMIIVGIPFMKMNSDGFYCWRKMAVIQDMHISLKIIQQSCFVDDITKYSLINIISSPEIIFQEEIIGVLGCFGIMVILFLLRIDQIAKEMDIDKNIVSVADFTIYLKRVPIGVNVDYQKEIRNIFQNQQLEVINVCLVYNLKIYKAAQEKLNQKIEEKQKFLSNFSFKEIYTKEQMKPIHQFDTQITQLVKEVELSKEITQKDKTLFSGAVFVTFNTQEEKERAIRISHEKKVTFQGKSILVMEASEPHDFDWENTCFTTKEKTRNRIIGFGLWIVVVAIQFMVLIFLKQMQQSLVKNLPQKKTNIQLINFILSLITYAIPVTMLQFNRIYNPIIKKIIFYEYWSTKTRQQVQYAFRYAAGGVLLQIVVILVICGPLYDNYYGPSGFIYLAERFLFLKPIAKSVYRYIDPSFRRKVIKQDEQQRLNYSVLTQEQANLLMEYPNYNLAKAYGEALQMIFQGAFLAPLLPIVIFYTIIGMIIFYWIEKYTLIKKRCAKHHISYELTVEMIELLEMTILVFSFSSFLFRFLFVGKFSYIDAGMLLVGIIYSVLPMEKIAKKYSNNIDVDHKQKYNEFEKLFYTDYNRENPILRGKALYNFIQKQSSIQFDDWNQMPKQN